MTMQGNEDWNNAKLQSVILELIRLASTELPADVAEALIQARKQEEPGSNAEFILASFLENIALAKKREAPLCQDTGAPTFYISHPLRISRSLLRGCCEGALIEATQKEHLRPNAVDSVTGTNSGDNIGLGFPPLYFTQWDEPAVEISLMLKGGGSENVGRQYSLPHDALQAGRNLEGVRRVILDAVIQAEGKGCPPGILGICLGGDRGSGYLESKRQLLRRLDDSNPDPVLADLERRLMEEGNRLGIGPLGLGGKTTLLGVKIGALHRLPACYFVTLSYMCWECRRRTVRIEPNGSCRFTR